ncbi:hypothetical protein [Actinomarinicola tropica]|uniref:Uncharacterized protein n=1 Tax=Actinomarinicola tropica TaxID=2789776 RepID=A0A5Q2RKE0_9ACTN|nr:hypothetical protein [Actinomarinicola tropica]QGG95041.1 hypothetical protein GH723_07930 [Actinomarinicola tropica]
MEPRHAIRRIRERADRGATFVEYALLGGLLALTSLASMQFLIDTTEQGFEETLNDVGTPIEVEDPGPSDPDPSDPGPSDPGPSDPGPSDPGPSDPGPSDPGPSDPGPSDPGPSDPGPSDPQPDNPDSGSRWNEATIQGSSQTTRECVATWIFGCWRWDDVTTVRASASLQVLRQNGSAVRDGSEVEVLVERWTGDGWQTVRTVTEDVQGGALHVDVDDIADTPRVRMTLRDVSGRNNGWDGQQSSIVIEIP